MEDISSRKILKLIIIYCSKCSIDAAGAREFCNGLIHLTALHTLNIRYVISLSHDKFLVVAIA